MEDFFVIFSRLLKHRIMSRIVDRIVGIVIVILIVMVLSVFSLVGCASEPQITLENIEGSEMESVSDEQENSEEIKVDSDKTETDQSTDDSLSQECKDVIYVYICGQVKNPGVYELPVGSRICDGIRAAEGTLSEAAADQINQAEIMEDGQRIYIPSKEEVQKAMDTGGWNLESGIEGSTGNEGDASGKVNLNTASKEELMSLAGIGAAKADAIIKYRENSGKFEKPEDLMNVAGIKEGTYNKIKDSIIV